MAALSPGSARNPPDPVREALTANKGLFGVAFAFSAAMSILALTVSLYMLQVYDRVLSSRSEETLLLLTIIAFIALAVFGVLDSLRLRLLIRTGMRFGESLGSRVLRAMVSSSALSAGSQRQGLRDIDTIRNFVGSAAFAILLDTPFLFLFLIVLWMLHPIYFVIVLIGGAILVGIALLDQYLTAVKLGKSITTSLKAHTFAEDGLRNADVLEGMGMSHQFVSRWRQQWLESLRHSLEAADRDSVLSGTSKVVRQLIQVIVLGTGALLVLDYHATGGIMIAASILSARALAPIEGAVSTWKSIVAVRLAWGRLVTLLNTAPRREEGMALPAPTGELQVQKVSFAPPGSRKAIVNGVSFALQPGESCGVIGPSASGKSSLMRLLVGAWPTATGVVRLDGADIYAWPRKELSRYIGYLPQDVELFGGTVKDNIARLTEGDPEEVVNAAKLANAHEMILALPKGYDTDLGENGAKLSGGQRQRVGIARALYGDPKLIVLDEPNSNLDTAGEEALIATLGELKKRRVTVVVVAHRPSMLANVDKMLVLRDGMVEAFGPRAEVMSRFAPRAGQQPQVRPAQNVIPLTLSAAGGETDGGTGGSS
jgi:PrtD family type I secretion system ABC transporter